MDWHKSKCLPKQCKIPHPLRSAFSQLVTQNLQMLVATFVVFIYLKIVYFKWLHNIVMLQTI